MEMKKFTRLSLLLALSVVLNIVEATIPFFNGAIPGLKLGLANIVILFVLKNFSFNDAIYLSVLRVFLVGILRTGLFSISFFFSLGGALLSVIVMALADRYLRLSLIGVSIIGSIAHSLGQIGIACLIINTANMVYYLPWLLLFSIPTGIFTGFITSQLNTNFNELYTIDTSLY